MDGQLANSNDWMGDHPLRPIVQGWIGKINNAIRFRQPWKDVADECEMFFGTSTAFLWDPKNRVKFWGTDSGAVNPKFKLTVSKAFELVALFGPALYWQNPRRVASPRPMIELSPELLGAENDPMAQAIYQAAAQEAQQEMPARALRSQLMEHYLNFTPNALRLQDHSELAITQALVTGRGLLYTEPYAAPGSDKIMVGSFYDHVKNHFIDPDAEALEDAWWVAQRCIAPKWKVERDYNVTLPKGDLESANAQGERFGDDLANLHRAQNGTQDLVVYYKVWSRCGVGARFTDMSQEMKDRCEILGDYCYLVVARDVPFPLNMPTERMRDLPVEDVQRAFRWPIPFYRLGRWPFSELDFYRRPGHCYPIAPLGPGLGELKFINVMLSHLCNRIWMSMRDFIAIARSASEELQKVLEKGEDLAFLPIDAVQDDVRKLVAFLQQPQVNIDAWHILEKVIEMFERRTGLSELLYGVQKSVSRSATDVKIREQMVSIRPEYMASRVERWQSEVAKAEALAARWVVTGRDVAEVMGRTGAYVWEQAIVNSPVERTVCEIDYRVEANSARRPNRDRDSDNLNGFIQSFAPLLDKHADVTGDTGPLNRLMEQWGKVSEMDVRSLMVGPRFPPGMGPEEQQAQMQAQQQAMQEQQAMQQQQFATQMAQKQQVHVQEMGQDQERHVQEMGQRREEGRIKIEQQRAQLKQAMARAKQTPQRNGAQK